jgi:hypothetical protein
VSARARAALLAGLVLATAVVVLATPARQLAEADGAGADPVYDVPIDPASVRRAAAAVPDDSTYFADAGTAPPLEQGNLKAAGHLFLTPALPLLDPGEAEWTLRYGPGGRVLAERR